MATTVTGLTSGTGSGATPSVPSISPTAGRVVIGVAYNNVFSGTARTHSIAGNNLTWAAIASGEILFGGNTIRCTAFTGLGASPSAGSPTITLTGADNVNDHAFVFFELSETHTTVPVVQAVNGSTAGGDPNSFSVTLSALADATNNAVIGIWPTDNSGTSHVPSTGYTELYDISLIGVHYKVPGTTTPGTTVAAAFADIGGIGIEFDHDVAAGGIVGRLLASKVLRGGILGGRMIR